MALFEISADEIYETRNKNIDFSIHHSSTVLRFSIESLLEELEPVLTETYYFEWGDNKIINTFWFLELAALWFGEQNEWTFKQNLFSLCNVSDSQHETNHTCIHG